jgi:hypothetical protein
MNEREFNINGIKMKRKTEILREKRASMPLFFTISPTKTGLGLNLSLHEGLTANHPNRSAVALRNFLVQSNTSLLSQRFPQDLKERRKITSKVDKKDRKSN